MTRSTVAEPTQGELESPEDLAQVVGGERTSVTRRYDLQVDGGIAEILASLPPPKPASEADSERTEPTMRPGGPVVHLEPLPPRPRSKVGLIVGGAAIGLLVLWGAMASRLWSRAETVAATPPPVTASSQVAPPTTTEAIRLPVSVRVDSEDRPVRLSASDPGRVVVAFCATVDNGIRYRPLGLASAPPPETGVMLGHVEDRFEIGKPLAIRIYLDPRTSRWSAGDGSAPVALVDPGPSSEPRAFGPSGPPEFELALEPVGDASPS